MCSKTQACLTKDDHFFLIAFANLEYINTKEILIRVYRE